MAIRKIRKKNDPILKKISKPVEKFDERLWQLLDDMAQTMKEEGGIGIAGSQVGILKKVIVLGLDNITHELINPEIIKAFGKQEVTEGCLSFPGEYGVTKRPAKIKVRAQDRNGSEIIIDAEKLTAAVICHEIDHLNGILFKSRIIQMLEKNESI